MIFFNSSMPRSGSTLMQNILGQNPNIHVTPTDGFLELIYGARVNYTNNAEFKAQDSDQMVNAWRGFCLSGMNGYASGLSNKAHTCIKSRGIGANYNWFSAFMGKDPKVICMVRNVKSVLASMEKIHRANVETASSIENPSEMRGLTTQSRVEQWLQGAPVGLALQRFGQMAQEGISSKCLFVKYEDLTSNPDSQIKRVYDYLDLPDFSVYEHDYNNVDQLTQEDDAVYGMTPDLHKIRPQVEYIEPDYKDILGASLCKWIDEVCAGYQEDNGYI
jgi:sulfotransferase